MPLALSILLDASGGTELGTIYELLSEAVPAAAPRFSDVRMEALLASLRQQQPADSSESDEDERPQLRATVAPNPAAAPRAGVVLAASAGHEMGQLFDQLRSSSAPPAVGAAQSGTATARTTEQKCQAAVATRPLGPPTPMLPSSIENPTVALAKKSGRASASSVLALLGPPRVDCADGSRNQQVTGKQQHVSFAPGLVTATKGGGGTEIMAELAAVEAERDRLAAMSLTERLAYRAAQRRCAGTQFPSPVGFDQPARCQVDLDGAVFYQCCPP